MSWFKRDGSLRSSFSRRPSLSRQPLNASACLEAFQMHWIQAWQIMDRNNLAQGPPCLDDLTGVLNHLDQMVTLLIQECANNLMDSGQTQKSNQAGGSSTWSTDPTVPAMFGPLLDYMLIEDVLQKLFIWSCHCGEHQNVMKLEQLKIYELLVSHSKHELLFQKSVVWPMMQLLSTCSECAPVEVEKRLIILLNTLCVTMNQNPQLLEVFFTVSSNQESARFLVFSLLIPFVHREGAIGQQARDALLLCMSLSRKDESIGLYIAEHSNFCPVLATGLSGLYSLLPRKLPVVSEDWHRFTSEDIQEMPELAMFLNSLEFCNAVVQVAHTLVQEQLLEYVHQGFLVPVLGPALHQDILGLPLEIVENSSIYSNSVEEIVATTAYLELFLRTVTEPALLQVFLRFILTDKFDGNRIIDSLVNRLGAQSRLCVVTMALFRTLLDLNCEDILLELVLKYLLPCSHVMVSQRSRVRDIDMYCCSAEKFLSLIPACCLPDVSSQPSSPASNSPSQQDMPPSSLRDLYTALPFDKVSKGGSLRLKRHKRSPSSTSYAFCDFDALNLSKSAVQPKVKLEHLQTCYLDYLNDAALEVRQCARACKCWAAPYDGLNPPAAFPSHGCRAEAPSQSQLPNEDTDVDDLPLSKTSSSTIAEDKQDARTIDNGDINDETLCESVLLDNIESDSMIIIPEKSEVSTELLNRIGEGNVNIEGGIINLAESCKEETSEICPANSEEGTQILIAKLKFGKMSDQEYDQAFWTVLQNTKTPSSLSDGEDFFEFSETSEVPNEVLSNGEYSSLDTIMLPPNAKGESSPSDSGMFESRESNSSSLDREANASRIREWCTNGGSSTEKRTEQVVTGEKTESKKSASFLGLPPISIQTSNWESSFGSPDIGPFLSLLLTRLEMMLQNDVYINLQLTGLISRLAMYPQPLLLSFLLNHSLVFQPSVRSLLQVLGSLKHKVDSYSYTVDNFEELLVKARLFLIAREERLLGNGPPRVYSEPPVSRRSSSPEIQRGEGKRRSFTRLFFGRSNTQDDKKKSNGLQEAILESIADGQGYRFVNKTGSEDQTRGPDSFEAKNAVLCAVILEEFLKELAAISQEHAILQADPEFWDCR